MLYKELEAEIDAGSICVGDTLWITDLRYDDIANKLMRNIAPTRVVLYDNANLPANKRVYYANHHFRPLGKNGNPLATIIAPYDNTGFRGFTGTSVNIFKTEQEAKACFVAQCEVVRTHAAEAQLAAYERFQKIIEDAQDKITTYSIR